MTAKRFFLTTVLVACVAGVAKAQPIVLPSPGTNTAFAFLRAGGLNPNPEITSTNISSGRVTINWNGFLGPYKVQWTTNAWAKTNTAATVNSTTRMNTYLCPNTVPTNASFRVTGPAPRYNSVYGSCSSSSCHGQIARDWVYTPHADALNALAGIGEQANSYCLPCHTVGYGQPTGYTTNKTYLAGVQCENCHGPTGGHAGTYSTPAVTINPKLCGGCHNGYNPQYDEWATTKHGRTGTNFLTSASMQSNFGSTNIATREKSFVECGFCHSGAVRLSLMKVYPTGAMPNRTNVLEVGEVGCVTCHDPHNAHEANGGDSFHLRWPMYSTNAFTFNSTNYVKYFPSYTNSARWTNAAVNYTIAQSNFVTQYNPNIMVCAQCHSARNTDQSLTTTSDFRNSKPHHSGQYNDLVANIGTTSTNVTMPDLTGASNTSMRHGINTNGEQCTLCHMTGEEGHTFEVSTNGCYQSGYCHDASTNALDTDMFARVDATSLEISNRMMGVVGRLNYWSTNAPAAIGIPNVSGKTTIKWEYSSVGALTTFAGITNAAGPVDAQQDNIPIKIRQARQNLYLVNEEFGVTKAYGAHNPTWSRYLIDVASNLVESVQGL